MTLAFEQNGAYVKQDQSGQWVVFRPSQSGTYAESDCAFPAGVDGLSCAIARAMYIAGGARRGIAKDALQLAQNYLAKAKAHGARNRAALAALDTLFN
jgi:hypothetical protein